MATCKSTAAKAARSTYRIDLRTLRPLRFVRQALTAGGRVKHESVYPTLAAATSLIGLNAGNVIVTDAARKADQDSRPVAGAIELGTSELGCAIVNDNSGVYEQITIECPQADTGPAAELIDEIQGEECGLQNSLDEFPIGLTCDPNAKPADDSMTELAQARDLLRAANDLIESVCAREQRYSPNSGYTLPAEAAA